MTTTAAHLNNRGIRYLEDCDFKNAAESFKTASKHILKLTRRRREHQPKQAQSINIETFSRRISSDRNGLASIPHSNIGQHQQQLLSGGSSLFSSSSSSSSSSRSNDADDTCIGISCYQRRPPPSPVLVARQDVVVTSSIPAHVIGQPLWMKIPSSLLPSPSSSSDVIGAPSDDPYIISKQSAIIFYNLGLTFHISSWYTAGDSLSASLLSLKAIEMYKMAKKLVLAIPATSALQSPVLLVSLHNLAMAFFELEKQSEGNECINELVKVLRLLSASSDLLGSKNYEEFYLKLLSVAKNVRSMASPAA
jgi:hypothetical protein